MIDAAFGASDLFGALVTLADSFSPVATLDPFGRVDALPELLGNVGIERAYPTPPLPMLSVMPTSFSFFGDLGMPGSPATRPLQPMPPQSLLAVKRARTDDHAADDMADDDEYRKDKSYAAAVGRLGARKMVHIRLTDTAPQDNKGSTLCHSLLAAGRALVEWGFESSITVAAKTLGRRRWHGELTGIVYGRVAFVFGESEAVAQIADIPDAATLDMPRVGRRWPPNERQRLVKPPRVITVVPLETLERLAKTANKGPRCIKVRLVDLQNELGDVCCDSSMVQDECSRRGGLSILHARWQ